MNRDALDVLMEAASTPLRERDPDGRLLSSPAWWDLPPETRDELFRRQNLSRALERARDPRGWSGTVKAVLERLA